MKIRFRTAFKFTLDNKVVEKIEPGTYDVPSEVGADIAELALSLGMGIIVPEERKAPPKRKAKRKSIKKAPENKALGTK